MGRAAPPPHWLSTVDMDLFPEERSEALGAGGPPQTGRAGGGG